MAEVAKDIIYIDLEDEITTIIDKVQSSRQKIVALVLPKRSTVLQSTVNMRLLKRSAENAKKSIVLITTEASLLPLAGATGLHVAKNLHSKPAVPKPPVTDESVSEVDEDSAETETEPALDENAPVGELAAAADDTETIELDNESEDEAGKNSEDEKPAEKKEKKLKVPNFDKFRLGLGAAVAIGIALIVFLILAFTVMPKATVTIKTDSTPVTAALVATTSAKATALDEAKNVLPAQQKELKKTDTEKVPATGTKDLGNKASGTVVISNCTNNPITISSGTAISSGGLSYIMQNSVSLDSGNFTSGGNCKTSGAHVSGNINVIAQSAGEQFNAEAKSYQISGVTGDVRAAGSEMTGGSSKVAKVVAQADVDSAKQKIATKNANTAADFKAQLEKEGFYVFDETATTSDPKVTVTPPVGSEATEVTVTQAVTYSVLVVKRDELTKLLTNALKKEIDTTKQRLSDEDVLKQATIRVTDKKSATDVTINIEKTTTAVPILNQEALKKEVAGKKTGDIQSLLGNRPGIKDVSVKYSPFWVSSVPKKTGKVTIVIVPQNDKQP